MSTFAITSEEFDGDKLQYIVAARVMRVTPPVTTEFAPPPKGCWIWMDDRLVIRAKEDIETVNMLLKTALAKLV